METNVLNLSQSVLSEYTLVSKGVEFPWSFSNSSASLAHISSEYIMTLHSQLRRVLRSS